MWYQFQHKAWVRITISIILFMAFMDISIPYAHGATCFSGNNLADIPLDAKVGASPGIIMFLVDDSGSMEWSLLLEGVAYASQDGYFDDGNNSFTEVFNPDSGYEMYWKTQWHGVNKLYYNPGSEYTPWPGESDADSNYPENPYFSSDDISLSSDFFDFAQVDQSEIEDSPGTVIVDDLDVSDPNEGIIIDNLDPGFSKTGPWGDSTSDQDWGADYFWTPEIAAYTATWEFTGLEAGDYDVYVRWVQTSTRSDSVTYEIQHDSGSFSVVVNQKENGGIWNLLGSDIDFDGTGKIILDHYTGNVSTQRACADAVKLVPKFSVAVEKSFQSSGVWSQSDSGEAYPDDGPSNGTYQYSNGTDSNFTATWTAFNLDENENYNVYVRWTSNSNRSTAVKYSIVHDNGTQIKHFDQKANGGIWRELASDISFSNGTGQVVLDHYTLIADSDRASADAVAFVLSDAMTTSDITVANSHYYIKGTDDNTYLVNIINNGFEYYRVDHSQGIDTDEDVAMGDDTDNIVDGELIQISQGDAVAAGIVTGRSYLEERQNFANWFAFYRKRQYTAKNALGKVIDDMSGVRIGILGINSTIQQEALPIDYTRDNTTFDRTDDLLSILYNHDPSGYTPLRNGLKRIGDYFEGSDTVLNSAADDLDAYISNDSKPFFNDSNGGACGQAFCILMTDGYYNGSLSGINNTDGDNNTSFDGGKFADDKSNTLADVAMHYYERDLNSNLSDSVPTTNLDQASHQHMVTFAVSFGVKGEIDMADYPTCPLGDCPADWWVDGGDTYNMKIDDLYHAAVNGRGDYINAGTPEELTQAMNELGTQITSRLGSAAAAATNSIQVRTGTKIYQGTYYSDKWSGELVQYSVDRHTGVIGDIDWSAKDHLNGNSDVEPAIPEKRHDQRVIFSYNGSHGIAFKSTDDGGEIPYGSSLVKYLRGDDSHNTENGGTYRVRDGKLGDVIHSAPVVHGNRIYVGANDGMLHAFNRDNGEELFAYVPKILVDMDTLPSLASTGYTHLFYVDNTVHIRDVNDDSAEDPIILLTGGLRKGGKGCFLLNISDSSFSDPSSPSESDAQNIVKWEYSAEYGIYNDPQSDGIDNDGDGMIDESLTDGIDNDGDGMIDESATDGVDNDNDGTIDEADEQADEQADEVAVPTPDDDLGFSYSRAYIVNTNSDTVGWVVIFGNGYDSVNQEAVLYMIDIDDTGAITDNVFSETGGIKKFVTGVGSCNGMSSPAIIDDNADGKMDYLYAGDLKGNLWKFDFSSTNHNEWDFAYKDSDTPKPLITVKNDQGGQPITVEPNVMRMECLASQNGYMVVFGTGQYLGVSDPANQDTQTFYGIWDWQDEFIDTPKTKYLGEFNADSPSELTHVPSGADSLTLLGQSIDTTIEGYQIMTDEPISWFTPPSGDADGDVDHVGWYFNLSSSDPVRDPGARAIQSPLIRPGSGGDLGIVTFVSSVPSNSDCGGSAGYSWLFQVSACNGGETDNAQFNTNGDGYVNDDDSLDDPDTDAVEERSPTAQYFDDMLYRPIQVGPYLYINDSSGSPPNQVLIPPNMEGIYYWRMID